MAIDNDKLQDFLHKFVGDLGATVAAGSVVIGHNLGLYKALAGEPATAEELASRTQTNPRYVAEWLRGQAASGYVSYDAEGDRYSMTEEQAFILTDPDGAVYAPGARSTRSAESQEPPVGLTSGNAPAEMAASAVAMSFEARPQSWFVAIWFPAESKRVSTGSASQPVTL